MTEADARELLLVAVARHRSGAFRDGLRDYRRVTALAPSLPPALRCLSYACHDIGLVDQAEIMAGRAAALEPSAVALLLRGYAEIRRGREPTAMRWLRRGVALGPGEFDLLNNIAVASTRRLGPTATAAWASRALCVRPSSPEARLNRANAWLALGRWREAWPDHDLRLVLQHSYPHALTGRRWDGTPAPAERLLVHDEIGYGDVFNYLRYLPQARDRVGGLTLEVKPGLARLLARCPGIDHLLERGPTAPPPSVYDLHVPIESLPGLFGTTVDHVPSEGPPPHIDTALRDQWRRILEPLRGVRIGLAWAGNPASGLDRARSCALVDLRPLASVGNVTWVSLQKSPAIDDAGAAAFGAPIVDLGSRFTDFADTAAVVAELDAVVTVETAVAHLAGVLGKPTFVLLSRWPAWRWLLDRPDTPWYRSVVLFRQHVPGDWTHPVAALRRHLGADWVGPGRS